MRFREVLERIENPSESYAQTYLDLKKVIFWDDLTEDDENKGSILEMVATSTYYNFGLIHDSMRRLKVSIEQLKDDAFRLICQYPESYSHSDDREWAIWDLVDGYVLELLSRDSRIRKRAGWQD